MVYRLEFRIGDAVEHDAMIRARLMADMGLEAAGDEAALEQEHVGGAFEQALDGHIDLMLRAAGLVVEAAAMGCVCGDIAPAGREQGRDAAIDPAFRAVAMHDIRREASPQCNFGELRLEVGHARIARHRHARDAQRQLTAELAKDVVGPRASGA